MRRLEVVVAAAVLAVVAFGLAVLPLQSRWYTEALATRLSAASEAGLSRSEAVLLAEDVRLFVVSGRGNLPVAETPSFEADEVRHLRDVQVVLRRARLATMALVVIAIAWLALRVRRSEGKRIVSAALKSAAAIATGTLLLLGGAALIDFDAFFSAFHRLFFSAGSWTFPYDSLIIRLFPERFWVVSGVMWALSALVIAAAYALTGRQLARNQPSDR